MEQRSIERELHIDAPPEVVFEVLSSPEHIREWWNAESEHEPRTGEVTRLTWTDQDTGRRQSTPFTVVEVDPPRRFSFRWTHDEDRVAAADNSLLVTFDLVPSGEGTTLLFSETGWRERGWEAAVLEAQYADHVQGWEFYLPRLAARATRRAA